MLAHETLILQPVQWYNQKQDKICFLLSVCGEQKMFYGNRSLLVFFRTSCNLALKGRPYLIRNLVEVYFYKIYRGCKKEIKLCLIREVVIQEIVQWHGAKSFLFHSA